MKSCPKGHFELVLGKPLRSLLGNRWFRKWYWRMNMSLPACTTIRMVLDQANKVGLLADLAWALQLLNHISPALSYPTCPMVLSHKSSSLESLFHTNSHWVMWTSLISFISPCSPYKRQVRAALSVQLKNDRINQWLSNFNVPQSHLRACSIHGFSGPTQELIQPVCLQR